MKRFRFCALALCLALALQPLWAAALSYTGSASYAGGQYYAALMQVTLTGDPRTDVVAIAQSQIGYQEGGDATQLSGEVTGSANYTEYGCWYGLQDMWCAMFVSWCAYNALVPTSVVPKHSFTVSGLNQFIAWGRAYTRAEVEAGTYVPQAGDIIYFKSPRNTNKTNHVGIVTGFSGSTIYTVEGNTSSAEISTNGGAVCAKSYSTSNTFIVYVCCPDYGGTAVTPPVSGTYFPACAQSCGTISEGLANIGADTSYAYRKRIAAANNIEDYSGTAAQNTQMLSLLKAGTLKKPTDTPTPSVTYFPACDSSYQSLTDALRSVGADSTFAYRERIAAANGIEGYEGTSAQNIQLLTLLKAGTLIVPDAVSDSACGCGSAYQEHVLLAETCTEDGAEYDRCTKCGAVSNRVTFPAAGHAYVCATTGATCTEAGSKVYTCSCGDTYAEAIAPLGHDFDASVLQNVTVADGTKRVRCSRCDACLVNTPGDVNQDGVVDLKDVVVLRRALADWDVTADAVNADVNADNSADLKDAALISRFLAGGWGVQMRFAL